MAYWRPKNRQEIEDRYGKILTTETGSLYWPKAKELIVACIVPEKIQKHLMGFGDVPAARIYANKDIHMPLLSAFAAVMKLGLEHEFKTFDGCYNVRFVRGVPGRPSLHSYGIAVDFNAADMPLNAPSKWSKEFVKCWTDVGWTWGGKWNRLDCQHFEWCDNS